MAGRQANELEAVEDLDALYELADDFFVSEGLAVAAVPAIRERIETDSRHHGERSQEVARGHHVLGKALTAAGSFDDAIESFQTALGIYGEYDGESVVQAAVVLRSMAATHNLHGQHTQAMECADEALRRLGWLWMIGVVKEPHEMVGALVEIGNIHYCCGRHHDALANFTEALHVAQRDHGEEHLDLAKVMNNMADAHRGLGELDRAMELYTDALRIHRSVLGEEHPLVAATLHNMGIVHRRRGEMQKAVECYSQALRIERQALGEEHPEVAKTLHNMGIVHQLRGELHEAMESYSQALRIDRRVLGEEHPQIGDTLYNMALLHEARGDYVLACDCFTEAARAYHGHDGQVARAVQGATRAREAGGISRG